MQSLDPVVFNQVPQVFGFPALRVGVDEVQNMYLHILQTLVVREVEVFSYLTSQFVILYVVEVRLESVHHAFFCLAHVLFEKKKKSLFNNHRP